MMLETYRLVCIGMQYYAERFATNLLLGVIQSIGPRVEELLSVTLFYRISRQCAIANNARVCNTFISTL